MRASTNSFITCPALSAPRRRPRPAPRNRHRVPDHDGDFHHGSTTRCRETLAALGLFRFDLAQGRASPPAMPLARDAVEQVRQHLGTGDVRIVAGVDFGTRPSRRAWRVRRTAGSGRRARGACNRYSGAAASAGRREISVSARRFWPAAAAAAARTRRDLPRAVSGGIDRRNEAVGLTACAAPAPPPAADRTRCRRRRARRRRYRSSCAMRSRARSATPVATMPP